MDEARFQVIVREATGSPEDWARVIRMAPSDLPPLAEEEQEWAKRFQWDQQDYARGKLLRQLAEEKWIDKGQRLGSKIQEILKPLESEYHLKVIFAEVPKSRWTVRFAGKNGLSDVHLDDDLVEDVINLSAREDSESLRRKLLAGLGEEKYIVSR